MLGILIVAFHVAGILLIWSGIRSGRLKTDHGLLPVVIFLPLWGEICALLMHYYVVKGWDGARADRLEVMRQGYEKPLEIPSGSEETAAVVPLEDALLINEPGIRRSLIMDVLMQESSAGYLPLLNQARMNEDVEVVHYAATAMAEFSKEYDLRLQQLEAQYRKNPEDEETEAEYLAFLEEYMDNHMVQGSLLMIQKSQYLKVLRRKISRKPLLEDMVKLVEGEFFLEQYPEAVQDIEELERRFPDQEEVWMLKLEYYFKQKQGNAIRKLVKELEDKGDYLSSRGREILGFWKEA